MQCAVKACHLAFHPQCAKRAGARLEFGRQQGYCWKHSDINEAVVKDGSSEDGQVDVVSTAASPPKKRSRGRPPSQGSQTNQPIQTSVPAPPVKLTTLSVPLIEVPSLQGRAKAAGHRTRIKPVWLLEPIAPRALLDRLVDSPDLLLNDAQRMDAVAAVCKYWSLRRSAKRGMPLLRRLQLEPWSSSGSATLSDDQAVEENFATRRYVLEDLRRLSSVTEAVLAGERKRIAAFSSWNDAFHLATEPLLTLLRILMRQGISLDTEGYFLAPVSLDLAPDYPDFVFHPMDFSSIAAKLESRQYETLASFTEDLQLIWTNCMTYNHPDTVYYQAAEGLRDGMEPLLWKAKEVLEGMGVERDGQISLAMLAQVILDGRVEIQKDGKGNAKGSPSKSAKIAASPKKIAAPAPRTFKHRQPVWAPRSTDNTDYFPALVIHPSRLSIPDRATLPTRPPLSSPHSILVCFEHHALDEGGKKKEWTWVESGRVREVTESFRRDCGVIKGMDEGFKVTPSMKDVHRLLTS